MKGAKEWLMDVGLRLVGPRLAVAALGALAGILVDAGLLDGELGAQLLRVLGP